MKAKSKMNVYRLTTVAVMAALSIAIQLLIPEIPIFPPSFKLGFALVPAIITALVAGPVSGILVVLITNIADIIKSDSLGMGQLINIVMGVACIFFLMSFYRLLGRKRDSSEGLKAKPYFISAVITTPLMAVVGIVVNFILMPLYLYIFAGNAVDFAEVVNIVIFASVPFNLIKFGILTIAFYPVYYAIVRSTRNISHYITKTV